MIFSVTYRNKQQERETLSIDAENRAAVFAELERRNIHAISVVEGRPQTAKRPLTLRGIVAGGIVLAGAIGAYLLIQNLGGDQMPVIKSQGEGKSIAEAKVAESTVNKASVRQNSETVEAKATETKSPQSKTYRDERGILRYEGGLRVPGQRPLAEPIQLGSHQPPRFKHDAEEHISWLLEMKIGEPVIGDYRYGDRFRRSFAESLAEPVEMLDTDDEYTRQLKADVEETKKELKARVDAGEDVAAIMNETMDEYRRLAAYKHDLQIMLSEIRNDTENYTDQDVEDFVKAANEMLKKNGLPPMKMPRAIMRGLRK